MRRRSAVYNLFMKVNVTICSHTAEEKFESSSSGEISFENGGFCVRYFTDGDECTLEYSGGAITQRRSGKLNFTMQFALNRQTECILAESGSSFSFPVFTHACGVSFSQHSGCKVTLEYDNGGSEERTQLIFIAERGRVANGRRAPRLR